MGTIQGPITPERITRVTDAVVSQLLAIAQQHNFAEPIIRDILPNTDLNALSGEIWQQDVSVLGFATNYSGVNTDDRAFVIFGGRFKAASPRTTAIRFFDGVGRTRIKDIWQVEQGEVDQDLIFLAEPNSIIEYLPSAGFNIDFFAKTEGIDNVILLGKVVEPKGKTISPKS